MVTFFLLFARQRSLIPFGSPKRNCPAENPAPGLTSHLSVLTQSPSCTIGRGFCSIVEQIWIEMFGKRSRQARIELNYFRCLRKICLCGLVRYISVGLQTSNGVCGKTISYISLE
ncbi:hypothetical protein CDAR_121541 [Caerostris darwini]|uniref:Secreted protein n=1 Tax=Caerostris darwini TaxID=1538125 RepID=A0AAV4V800_9ARAC|nr:hypothetical protein CDAR_121541 [Caerostris darwini]